MQQELLKKSVTQINNLIMPTHAYSDLDIFDLCDLTNRLWYFNEKFNLDISKDDGYQDAMAELKRRIKENYF